MLGEWSSERFANGELYLRLNEAVEDRLCVVLGSLAPPDERLLAVLLLGHTLKREGAKRVVALLPYLGYARQDRADPGQSLGAAWIGTLLAAAGVDELVTVDVHSADAAACLAVPARSLSPAPIFARVVRERGLSDVTLVAPDEGAVARCEAVAQAAGIEAPVAYLRKRRTAGGIAHSALVGDVTSRVLIVDDILDTGSTLISGCRELRRAGAQDIVVMVAHGLFTGDGWRELPALGVQQIYATDTVPDVRERAGGLVEVLPVGHLLLDALTA